MIVIDDDWVGAADRAQFVNVSADDVLGLDLDFSKAPTVEITAVALPVEGKHVTRVPRSRREASETSGYRDEVRQLRADDPDRQLFILRRRAP